LSTIRILPTSTPAPALLTGVELAEHFDAGRRVLDELSGVDDTTELMRQIERLGPVRAETALFTATVLLRLSQSDPAC